MNGKPQEEIDKRSPDEEEASEDKPASGRQWFNAIAWVAAGKWAAQCFSWVSSIFIARLLSPDDFGLLTMTTVFVGLVSLLSEGGIGAAALNLPNLTRSQLRQLNSLALGLGVCAFIGACFSANLVGGFYRKPELALILPVVSIPLILSSIKAVPNALLQKALRFRLISGIECLQAVTQASITLILAWIGLGYWSLVAGIVAGSLVSTVAVLFYERLAYELPRLSQLRTLYFFSSAVLVSNLSWYGYSNADFVLAGRMLGSSALGVYSLAWSFATAPSQKLGAVIMRVVPGFFAKHAAAREGIRGDLCRVTKGIALVVFPASIGLALTAEPAIRLALGEKWQAATAPLQYLCLYLPFAAITVLLPHALNAAGKPSIGMFNSLLKLVVLPPAFYVASRWGAPGIALAWLLIGPILTLPLYRSTLRHLGLGVREYAASLRTPCWATLAMGLCVWCARALLPHGAYDALSFAAEVAIGMAVYIGVVLWLQPEWVPPLVAVLRRARKGLTPSKVVLRGEVEP